MLRPMAVAATMTLLWGFGGSIAPTPAPKASPPVAEDDSRSSRLEPGREAILRAIDPSDKRPAPAWGHFYDTSEEHWHVLSPGDKVLVISDESTELVSASIGFDRTTRKVLLKVLDGEDRGRVGKASRDMLAPIRK